MKVALISTFLGQKWSGGEVSSFLLAEILNKKEDVFVITSKVAGRMPFRCYSFNFLRYIPNLVLLVGHHFIDRYLYRHFLKIFKQEKPEVIHLQDYSMMVPALKVARRLKIPVVFTARSYQFMCNLSTCLEENRLRFNCSKRQYKKCLKKSVRSAYGNRFNLLVPFVLPWFYSQNKKMISYFKKIDYYITVSDFVKEQIIKSKISSDKIQTIKVPKVDWVPGKEKKKKIIFSAGGLKKTKGFHYLIKSLRLVADKYPSVILRIAGKGSARDKLERMVKRLKLSKNIRFLGKISHDQMRQEYAQASFVVSPSLWPEPLSRIIFETFSMQRTIVATNVGGSSELVNRKTGLLVEPGNEQEMSAAMIKLIENPKLVEKLSLNAYKLIKRECDEERTYKEHRKVYEELVN